MISPDTFLSKIPVKMSFIRYFARKCLGLRDGKSNRTVFLFLSNCIILETDLPSNRIRKQLVLYGFRYIGIRMRSFLASTLISTDKGIQGIKNI